MAYKNLIPEEQIQISGTLLDAATKAGQALAAIDELQPKVKKLAVAHDILSAANQPSEDPRVKEIILEETGVDARHDAVIRGIWGFCTSQAELLGGVAGAAFISLRGTLLPDGLQSQLKTYRAEAGQAAQLATRMTPAQRQRTDAIVVGEPPNARPLTVHVDELISLGKQLGKLEDEKDQILAAPNDGSALVNARNGWVRVVNALVADAELADLPADVDALLFGPLRAAEKKADARARNAATARATAIKEDAEKRADERAAEKAAQVAATTPITPGGTGDAIVPPTAAPTTTTG
jgi:hypothetical protein